MKTVKFIRDTKDASWAKGDIGVIIRNLSSYPDCLSSIFLIGIDDKVVWATNEDIIPFDQLTLF